MAEFTRITRNPEVMCGRACIRGMRVTTSDLDFGAILALTGSARPSVILLRSEVTLPEHVGTLVIEAIRQAEPELGAGALLAIDEGEPRLRVLRLATKH